MNKLILVPIVAALTACTQIDTGNVGVESTLGQVKSQVFPPDVYFTLFKTMTEVCAKEVRLEMNDMKPQTSDKITLSDLDVDIFVQINPAKATTIMTKWAGDRTEVASEGCERVGMNFVGRQAREAIYVAVTKFNSATVHNERPALAADLVKSLQASLNSEAGPDMFFVRSANIRNLVTDPALEANIKLTANRQFEINAKAKEVELARLEAERKREEAKGEADAIRIKAEAVSKQGGAEYVQLQAIQKWDGKLPVTTAGGAVPFINVK